MQMCGDSHWKAAINSMFYVDATQARDIKKELAEAQTRTQDVPKDTFVLFKGQK